MNVFKRIFPLSAVLAALAMLVSGCSILIEPEARPTQMTVEELEYKMEDAMDPNSVYRNAFSYAQESVTKLSTWYSSADMIVRTYYKKDETELGKFRIEYLLDNKAVSGIIYKDGKAQIIDYGAKKIYLMSDEENRKMVLLVQLGQPDATYSDTFPVIDLFECTVNNVDYYWMRCYFNADKSGHPYDVFVNKETFLTKRIQLNSLSTGEYSAVIDEYATYETVTVPDVFTVDNDGITQTCDLIRYNLNVALPDSIFEAPDDCKVIQR